MQSLLHASCFLGLAALAADATLVGSPRSRDKIVYIKTHSTGSSTLTNLLHRYCDKYGKKCYVPPSIHPGNMCRERCLEELANKTVEKHTHFDVWPNHAVYVPSLLNAIVPGNVAMSVFREPFDRVMSSYAHGDESTVEAVLDAMKRNESIKVCGWNGTGTKMSLQVPLEDFDKLDFVIITEKYNLGLVMMRRFLGWKLEDIVYTRLKDHRTTKVGLIEKLRQSLVADGALVTEAARAFKKDCMEGDEVELYRRAKVKFWQQYRSLSPAEQKDVDAEVRIFRSTLARVQKCCEFHGLGDKYCEALAADNVEWVQQEHHEKRSFSFLRTKRTGCRSLVPDM